MLDYFREYVDPIEPENYLPADPPVLISKNPAGAGHCGEFVGNP